MKRHFTFLMAAFALMVSMMMPLGMKGQIYSRVSSVSDLADGDQIIFVNQDETYACGTTQNTNNRTPVAITVSNHTYSYSAGDNVQVFTVKVNSSGKYGFHTGSGYIYSASSTKNNLKTNTTPATTAPSGTSAWSLSASSSVFSCTNVTNTSYYLAFNGTSYFSQYTSGQSKPYIYKKQSDVSYTISFNPGNGSCATSSETQSSGTTITLPTASPSTTCADAGWTFAGWATSSIAETTTAPTLLTGSYSITGDATLYAVYKAEAGIGPQTTIFNFEAIASANNWINGTQYTTVTLSPITLTAFGGGNCGKYYDSNHTWRIYSSQNGGVTVTTTSGSITEVSSDPSVPFTISNGSASFTATNQTEFSSISVTYESSLFTFATSPICMEQVATPTFSPAAGSFDSPQNVTISCSTEDATIYYTTDGTTPTTSSTTYSSAIAVSSTTTIKAIAVKEGMSNSAVATATYTITPPCTITFNVGNGSCDTTSVTQGNGTSFTLPTASPSATCASMGWTFAGWATASVSETTTAPTLLAGAYTIHGNDTLYAVYRLAESSNTQTTEFNIETIADANSWQNAVQYSSITRDGITLTATGGGNDGKYYSSDETWRFYASSHGTVTVTASNNNVVAVTSNPTRSFSISNGVASYIATTNTSFKSITVSTGTLTYTYASSPDCWEPIATPTFSPAGGTYNAAQNVTLSCSTDSTSIYYTTNGTTPTSNSLAYSSPIPVGNGTTTIKAIAVKGGHSSDVATATYIIDSNQAGGEDNPYTVAQAVNATPASGTSDWLYVKGVVSEILEIEVMQYHNARYNISDDGTTSSVQLQSYRGRNIYNTDFLSEDELLVGDTVVIRGRLTTYVTHSDSIPELAEGNYIVSLSRAVEPVTFSPESCIMSSDNYGVFLFSESINEGWGVDIYYSIGANSDPIENGTYFDVWGDPIEVTQNTTIRAVAYIPDLDKYSAVTEATYTIVSPQSSGWQGNPYTVSEALDALDQNNNIKGAYVRGVISRISQIETTQYFNATYFISDDGQAADELQVYRGKYISRADFTSQSDILVGDTVTVFGDLTIYRRGNDSIKEFKPKNYIWDLSRPSSIVINQNQLEIDCNGASGIIDVIYSDDIYINVNNPTLQFCDAQGNAASYNWLSVTLSQNTNWDLEYAVDPNAGNQPRTAYLKVLCQNLVSNIVTITQNEYRPDFAELPFSFDGGRSDIESTAGLTSRNLGSDYSSSPKLKFENKTEDGIIKVSSLVLKINEVPGVLTFDIKGNNFSGGTFKVQASADGVVYSDMATYRTISSETQTKTINNLPTNTRYIRWIYVTKSSGNVAVGNIHLARPVVKYKINCEQPYYAGTQVGTITANKADAFEGETITLNAMPNNGYVFLEWSVVEYNSNQAVAVADSSATTTTFLMPYDSVTVSAVIVPDNTEYQYAYSINGTVGQLQTATIGTMLTLPAGSGISGQPFTFIGWTTNPNNVENVMLAGASYRLLRDVTFYAVYVESVAGSSADKHYVRVTEDFAQNWAGDYLIAYSSAIFADGRVSGTTSGGIGCANVSVAPGNNLHDNMVETIWGDIYRVTLEEVAAGSDTYLLKTQDGNYNYYTNNNGNGLSATANRDVADDYPITVNFVSANDIRLSLGGDAEGSVFRYNPQGFFRFYKNCGQEPVYLYKKTISTDNRYTRVFVDNPTGSLTITGPSIIPNGSVLNVASITNTLGADRLVVEEGAQLVTNSDVNATIKRFINPYQGSRDNYYLIASPVNNLNPATAGMTGDNFDLYAFDQSAQGEEWQNYEADNFNLAAGQGYLYANDYGGFINMGGTMAATADDVTIEHVAGKNLAGWNLIGNPYPCNVTIGKSYYRLAEGGAALAMDATAESVAIAPMEGVFVYADSEEEEVSFAKAPNTSTTGRGGNTLCLRVRHNQNTKDGRVEGDNAIVRFGEGSLLRKLVLNPDLPQIYVAQDGADYAIVNAEAEGELPISFRAAENGSYTISVNAEEVSFGYLHLIDNKTGADIDLLQTNNYTFDANTADYACRFKLVFATNSICVDVDGGNETFAYFNGSAWVVNGVDGGAILQVVDMTGRVILSNDAKAGISVNAMSQGIYVLRLIDGDNVKIQKIINK